MGYRFKLDGFLSILLRGGGWDVKTPAQQSEKTCIISFILPKIECYTLTEVILYKRMPRITVI